ncbi:hypothetical protein ISF9_093 [Microbacterium phage vB_MoxS-ISF9]|uniref:Uncharacterized protein n=1 Tax=Microbacterium phage vB_MoxS-ISF9 TaxID=1458670 RepID=W8NWP8_9CAUD|nr:hypothetical protein ISF9_093 [Microbacterium phage vB_MoxS-ISF9]AHL18563.1 hypothetical protein ISF9_093 [Microbacterium phage vB_MoxS-ISF9]
MFWLEGLAWAFLGTGSGVGIASISYVVKTRGWSYFTKLKTPFKRVRRKALSLSMIAELGADMAMDKWDEEFRKLVARSRPVEPLLTYAPSTMQEAVERAGWGGVAEKTDDRCGSCEYEDFLTYGSKHVKRYKTRLCDGCLEDEGRRAAREMINNMGLIYA